MTRLVFFSFLIILSLQSISQVSIDLKSIEKKIKKTNKLLAEEFSAIKLVSGNPTVDSFYISSQEVTNKQYREFLEYIQDSIVRKLMGYVTQGEDGNEYLVYSKKIKPKDIEELGKDFTPNPFFIHINGVWRFDSNRLVYFYKVENKRIQIPVMPDTSFWDHAKSSSTGNAVIADRLWLSAYNNYAITGVNLSQAQAYYHWKTQQFKTALSDSYDWDIIISSPSDSQWQSALTSGQLNKTSKKAIDETTGFRYAVSFKRKTE